jgi:hypothetical protein
MRPPSRCAAVAREICSPTSGHRPHSRKPATWPELRHELDRIAVGTFAGPTGTFRQRTGISDAQAAILAQLNIGPPPKICQLTLATTR